MLVGGESKKSRINVCIIAFLYTSDDFKFNPNVVIYQDIIYCISSYPPLSMGISNLLCGC